jgi:hypothetical protein
MSNVAIELGLPEDSIWEIHREARHWSGEILRQNREIQ